MQLKELLKEIPYEVIQGSDGLEIDDICWDSRTVKPSSLFICVKCRNIDRHDFALKAISAGAIALLIEDEAYEIPKYTTVIKVKNTKIAMASVSNIYFHEPSKKFNLIGITGTNGKTTVSHFIAKILEGIGSAVGIIGTIENSIGKNTLKVKKLNPTTPDSIELQASFSEMVDKGARSVVLEVTSTALENHRVLNCNFDIGVFTNLTQDHLEEHGTMENYKNAKMKLFKMCRLGIINADDPICRDIINTASCDIITYGIDNPADLRATDIQYSLNSTTFTLLFCHSLRSVTLNAPGKFNVYNILAAISSCYFLGFPLDTIINSLNTITVAPGRFQTVPNDKGFLIVVDYAHTPDALQNALTTARSLTSNKLIVVFGCGGDRDTSKRPIMGEIAGRLADFCVITSDNPRKESPINIIEYIETGMKRTACYYKKIENRKEAICAALNYAEAGDTVVISGKGHENYQIIGEKTIHFDDVEVIKNYLIKSK